jgi:hypothetical protein
MHRRDPNIDVPFVAYLQGVKAVLRLQGASDEGGESDAT